MTAPGTPPGTIARDPSAPKPVVRVMAYGPDSFHEETVESVESLERLKGKHPVTWIDVEGAGHAETVERIGQIYGLHPLCLEDVAHTHQRAKAEEYDQHLFLVTRLVRVEADGLGDEQVSIFCGKDFIVTFSEGPDLTLEPIRDRIRARRTKVRSLGPDYLAYAVLDFVVDHYFPVLDECGARLDELEDEVLDHPERLSVARVHDMRRSLVHVRRALTPHREAVGWLLRGESSFVSEEIRLYMRDCYDHVLRAADMIETEKERVASLMDVYLSAVSNRMNEVMKVLTVIATIFMPLTFLAGVYGMNFQPTASPYNMPELTWRYGYPACLIAMLATGIGFALYFQRRGWIGGRRRGRGKTGAG